MDRRNDLVRDFHALPLPSQRLARLVLIAGAPFVISWAYVSELGRGIKRAFRDALLEARIEIGSYRSTMRSTKPR